MHGRGAWVLVGALVFASACGSDDSGDGGSGGGSSGGGGSAAGGSGGGGNSGSGGSAGAGGTGGSGGSAGSGASGGTTSGGGSGGSGAAGSGGSGGSASGTLVPLYTDPSSPTWAALANAKKSHPAVAVLAVINPNDGPGTAKDTSYVTGTQALKDAGVIVLGYVATGWGATSATGVVQPAIDKYVAWYPAVTGIFFDEQASDAGKEAYYSGLTQYAKSKGHTMTVGNPGADVAESYVGTVDMMLIYESKGNPTLASLGGWHQKHDKKNFGIIPYGVSTLDTAFVQGAKQWVGYHYATDDDLPNPWDSLPPYFDALVAELAK